MSISTDRCTLAVSVRVEQQLRPCPLDRSGVQPSNNSRAHTTMNLVEVARSNPDVMSVLAALLDARGLCRVSQTCKALGCRQDTYLAGDDLSLAEIAAMRVVETTASDYEKSRGRLRPSTSRERPRESWIRVYHRLLKYRATPQPESLKLMDCCNVDGAIERLGQIKDRLVKFEIRGPE